MKFIVSQRFQIEADDPKTAIELVKQGIGITAGYSCIEDRGTIEPELARPIPDNEWPPWAKALKFLATPEDKGIGDIIHRTIGAENSDAFKEWYKKTTGKDCGCAGRQARWNIMYPFKTSEH